MNSNLLEVRGLTTAFPGKTGPLAAVDRLDLEIGQGEIVGLVGESGCGKSMAALSIMGLVPPPGLISAGSISFMGEELIGASEARLRGFRGAQAAMIFQEPMTSLNPVFTVGRQIAEGIRAHEAIPKAAAWQLAVEALDRVGIPDAAQRAKSYPHQMSGGMRQRVIIAMALAMKPKLLLADEPTTALDVTIQAQILGLMTRLQEETGASVLLITHDLAVVAQAARRVAVMYLGRLVERATVEDLFDRPLHPYTNGLLDCLPSRTAGGERLPTIGGIVPPLDALPTGCAFSDRCPKAFDLCRRNEPALVEISPGHGVRCFLHHDKIRQDRRQAA